MHGDDVAFFVTQPFASLFKASDVALNGCLDVAL